jgi:hypothetical protein
MVNILKILPIEPTIIAHHSVMNKDESKTEKHIDLFFDLCCKNYCLDIWIALGLGDLDLLF